MAYLRFCAAYSVKLDIQVIANNFQKDENRLKYLITCSLFACTNASKSFTTTLLLVSHNVLATKHFHLYQCKENDEKLGRKNIINVYFPAASTSYILD